MDDEKLKEILRKLAENQEEIEYVAGSPRKEEAGVTLPHDAHVLRREVDELDE